MYLPSHIVFYLFLFFNLILFFICLFFWWCIVIFSPFLFYYYFLITTISFLYYSMHQCTQIDSQIIRIWLQTIVISSQSMETHDFTTNFHSLKSLPICKNHSISGEIDYLPKNKNRPLYNPTVRDNIIKS